MPKKPIVAWIVSLLGHEFDLENLLHFLTGSAEHVSKRDDGYYLILPTSSVSGMKSADIRNQAAEKLALINGASSLICPSFKPVAIGNTLYGIDDESRIVNTVLAIDGIELRTKLGPVTASVNGIIQPDASDGAVVPFLQTANASTAAANALAIVGRSNPTWSELYLVFELIEANCGNRMYQCDWIQKPQATLFTRTVNSYTALGRKSRHGKDRGQPPPNPMTQSEAIKLIQILTKAWLRYLSTID